jgi:hypothetical protein
MTQFLGIVGAVVIGALVLLGAVVAFRHLFPTVNRRKK